MITAGDQRDPVEAAHRRTVAGPARALRALEDRARTAADLDRRRHLGTHPRPGDRQGRRRRQRGVDRQHRLQQRPGPPALGWGPEKGGCATGWVEAPRRRRRSPRTVPRRADQQDPPRRRRSRPADVDDPHPGPGRGQPATAPAARPDRGRPRRARPAAHATRAGAGRQGLLPPLDPRGAARRGIAFTSPERIDQIERRRAKGSRGGRPPGVRPPRSTPTATSSSAASTGSSSSAPWPPATRSEWPTTAPRSSSPPSCCGCVPTYRTRPTSKSELDQWS